MNHSIGRPGCHLSSIASTWNSETGKFVGGELRVELVFDDRSAKAYFAQIERDRSRIEQDLGDSLTWHNPADKRMCRIYAVRRPADISDRSKWPEYHAWLREKLEAFDRVFRPRVRDLAASEPDAEEPDEE